MDFQSIKLNRRPAAELEDVAFDRTSNQDIAIIGVAVKLPLADTVEQFEHNLRSGRDCIRPLPDVRKQDTDLYFKHIGTDLDSVVYGEAAYLNEIDKFDYSFFKLSPREASLMDPNQRLFLETAWRAIEDAGYGGGTLNGSRTGVYVGYGSDADYLKLIREVEPDAVSMSMGGNVRPIIASRLSYLMDLRGPSLLVDTTCSSSLVAVHLACQAMRNGECDAAIVGGIQLHLVPVREYEVGIESSTARARTFDDQADGTGTGEGVVVMMLKPLDQALEARDNIYAVIKGSSVNQDGGSVGITAPNAQAQEAVLADAWKRAGIDPESIGYIETHGTGTKLGDPIEIEGLERAFRRFTDKRQFCAIGALKSSIGHLDNTAGIAGLLKAVLSVKHKRLYPTLHFDRPNRVVNFAESPVYVNNRLQEWEAGSHPRRSGVSSFGISGTNCHIIVEEAPTPRTVSASKESRYHLFTLSAQSKSSLMSYVDASLDELLAHPELDLGDLCYTLCTGRGHYRYRLALIAQQVQEVVDKLQRLKSSHAAWDQDEGDIGEHGGLYVSDSHALNQEHDRLQAEVETMIDRCLQSDRPDHASWEELARLFAKGVHINGERLYKQERRRRVSFPTYPFDRHRCWVKLKQVNAGISAAVMKSPGESSRISGGCDSGGVQKLEGETSLSAAGQKHFYHQRLWSPESLISGSDSVFEEKVYLLLHRDRLADRRLIDRFVEAGAEVFESIVGERYEQLSEQAYQVGDDVSQYEQLLAELTSKAQYRELQIIDLTRLTAWTDESASIDEHEQRLNETVYQLYRLAQAITHHAERHIAAISLTMLSAYAAEVVADQARVLPEHSAAIGLSKALVWECPSLKLRWIDLDENTDLSEAIVNELQSPSKEFVVAYRQGKRYVERVEPLAIEVQDERQHQQPASDSSFKETNAGVYVITGGAGNIGLLMAEQLANEAGGPVRLALLGRTQPPARGQWAELAQASQDEKLKRAIRAVLRMERQGAHVDWIQADTANPAQLRQALEDLRRQHGRIAGVVHAAGVSEGNLISRLTREELQGVIAAKTTGTFLLDQFTRQDEPDFFVLFSSAITLVGGVGSGPYTAGNAYLDAYSAYRNRAGMKTLVINWPAWIHEETQALDSAESKEMFCFMPEHQGIRAFQELLQSSCRSSIQQAYVGFWNWGSHLFALQDKLPFRLSQQLQLARELALGKAQEPSMSRNSLGTLKEHQLDVHSSEASSGQLLIPHVWEDIEQVVTEAWKWVLGYEEIDANANFFEIGGDSILITRVQEHLEQAFPDLISIADLFSYPTIARLTSHLHDIVGTLHAQKSLISDKAEDEFSESMLTIFDRIKQGEWSIEEAVDRYRKLEVAHG